jgi:sulfur carrier protein
MADTITQPKDEGTIQLVVNGRPTTTSARQLNHLIVEQNLAGAKTATAVNGDFVPEARRDTTELANGDRVEIVSARQGG